MLAEGQFRLSIEDRNRLARIIADMYEFIDEGARGRRVLLQSAGLRRFIDMPLSGDALTIAEDLVGRLDDFNAYLPENPRYHPLGALLSYILNFVRDLPLDRASFLAGLMIRYSLVRDPTYIDRLRADYTITDDAVHIPAPAQIVSPRPGVARSGGPAFDITIPARKEEELESIIHSEDNFLDISLLAGAIYSAQAVCIIQDRNNEAKGTGLLIGPDLLLTNQHVLKDKKYLDEMIARFDYQIDPNGIEQAGRKFEFQTDFYHSSPPSELDYALVRLQGCPLKHMPIPNAMDKLSYQELLLCGKHRGFLQLAEHFIKEGDRVNIIQHPEGKPAKVVLTQNYVVVDMTEARVWYVADTMDGSSGSPVFNKNWEVIALHHSGKPYPPDSVKDTVKKLWKGKFRVNEGIPVRALIKDFKKENLFQYLPRS